MGAETGAKKAVGRPSEQRAERRKSTLRRSFFGCCSRFFLPLVWSSFLSDPPSIKRIFWLDSEVRISIPYSRTFSSCFLLAYSLLFSGHLVPTTMSNKTPHRLELTDYVRRAHPAKSEEEWTGEPFELNGIERPKFRLVFLPKEAQHC